MRKTGSREPRASLEASFMSPASIAVKTFSTRLGSRRNQRKPHQKQRSITTNKETMETIRIGHMIGPPARKFRMKKLELFCSSAAGAAGLASGATVAVTAAGDVPAAGTAGEVPTAGVVPGAAGEAPNAGAVPGAAGDSAGAVPGAAGDIAGAAPVPGAFVSVTGEVAGAAFRSAGVVPAGLVAGVAAGS